MLSSKEIPAPPKNDQKYLYGSKTDRFRYNNAGDVLKSLCFPNPPLWRYPDTP